MTAPRKAYAPRRDSDQARKRKNTVNRDRNNPRIDTRIRRAVDRFAGRHPRRSVAVRLHRPRPGMWTANPDRVHSGASLLKIPVVGGLLLAVSRGEATLSTVVPVETLDRTAYPTALEVFHGAGVRLEQLAALSIITSDNAAASYALQTAGPAPVGEFLDLAGCDSTDIPPGFSDSMFGALREAGTTAEDQLRILGLVWTDDRFVPLRRWMANNMLNGRLSARFEPPTVFAHKTGTLAGAVHDVGVLTTPKARMSVAVLTSERESDAVTMAAEMANLGCDLERAVT